MSRLALTSSAGIFVAGLLIFLCWVIAANDKKLAKGDAVGCVKRFNELIKDIPDKSLKRYYRTHMDAFPYLISFGVICGLLWMGTAFLSRVSAKLYLVVGTGTTIVFVCVFTPMVERMRDMRLCFEIGEAEIDSLFDTYERKLKRIEVSYELFWGSSMACFLLAAYQIGCAIAMVYEESMASTSHQEIAAPPISADDNTVKKQDEEPREEKKEGGNTTEMNLGPGVSRVEDPKASATSVVVKKGDVIPPAESPIPDAPSNDFSMNDF